MNRKSDAQIEKRMWLVMEEMTSLTQNKNRTPEEQNRLIQCIAYGEALCWALGYVDQKTSTKLESIKNHVYDDTQVKLIETAKLEAE